MSRPVTLEISVTTPKKKKPITTAASEVALVETQEESVIIDVPRDWCGQGQNLMLDLKTTGLGDEEVHTRIEAKVLKQHFDPHNADFDTVHLKFIVWDSVAWKRILGNFEARQAEVSKIFGALKN